MYFRKDNLGTQIALGMAIPACLLAVVAYNLASGWVYCPYRRSPRGLVRLIWTDDEVLVCFWVTIKLAAAVAMVAWFLLANRKRTEHLAVPGILLAIAMVVAGTIAATVLAIV